MIDLLHIGTFGKRVGTKGLIRVNLDPKIKSIPDNISFVFIAQEGFEIPYKVEKLKVEDNANVLLKVVDIDSPESALFMTGKNISIETSYQVEFADQQGSNHEHLVGYNCYSDKDILLGKLVRIDIYPQQEMGIIESENKEEILIPLNEEFILESNESKNRLVFSLPEGFLQLN